jgi:hypothetical protein
MQKFLLLLLFFPCLSFCQQAKVAESNNHIYPDSTWQYVNDPAKRGWNNDSINKLKRFIIDSTNATGMVVIQSGKILFDYGDIKETSYLASCRKSILSMLYGPFVKTGKINLGTTLEQLHLDDVGGLLPIEKKLKLKIYSLPGLVSIIRQAMKVMLLQWPPKEAVFNQEVFGYTIIGISI